MKLKTILVLLLPLFLTLSAAVCFGTQDQPGPSAFFPEATYEFTPVLDGSKVVHEFVIQNKGTAALTVEKVKTG
jgi:hypothetical protein